MLLPQLPVALAQPLRRQHLGGLTDQLRVTVTEPLLAPGIDQADAAALIQDEDGIRRRRQHIAKTRLAGPQAGQVPPASDLEVSQGERAGQHRKCQRRESTQQRQVLAGRGGQDRLPRRLRDQQPALGARAVQPPAIATCRGQYPPPGEQIATDLGLPGDPGFGVLQPHPSRAVAIREPGSLPGRHKFKRPGLFRSFSQQPIAFVIHQPDADIGFRHRQLCEPVQQCATAVVDGDQTLPGAIRRPHRQAKPQHGAERPLDLSTVHVQIETRDVHGSRGLRQPLAHEVAFGLVLEFGFGHQTRPVGRLVDAHQFAPIGVEQTQFGVMGAVPRQGQQVGGDLCKGLAAGQPAAHGGPVGQIGEIRQRQLQRRRQRAARLFDQGTLLGAEGPLDTRVLTAVQCPEGDTQHQ